MGVAQAVEALPSEELRNQIDGFDSQPERRQFARSIELFERELRAPLPNTTWRQLQRGHQGTGVRGLPTLQQRLDQRAYEQYCEPFKDLQPAWDAETERIARRAERIHAQQRFNLVANCLAGTFVGGGGLGLYAASLLFGPIPNAILASYAVVSLLWVAILVGVQVLNRRLSDA